MHDREPIFKSYGAGRLKSLAFSNMIPEDRA
jgi:hypothetical protein